MGMQSSSPLRTARSSGTADSVPAHGSLCHACPRALTELSQTRAAQNCRGPPSASSGEACRHRWGGEALCRFSLLLLSVRPVGEGQSSFRLGMQETALLRQLTGLNFFTLIE